MPSEIVPLLIIGSYNFASIDKEKILACLNFTCIFEILTARWKRFSLHHTMRIYVDLTKSSKTIICDLKNILILYLQFRSHTVHRTLTMKQPHDVRYLWCTNEHVLSQKWFSYILWTSYIFYIFAKGQIISKGLFGILGFFQKTNARI